MRRSVNFTTIFWLFSLSVGLSGVANSQDAALSGYEPPRFRAEADGVLPALPPETTIRLLADADFAPFSFLSASGAPAGLAVELAMAACAEAKLRCKVEVKPFGEILPALQNGEADVAVTGPRLEDAALRQSLMTRPYFRTMGRFAVQTGNPLTAADPRSLEDKRIGVVKDTVHARWLEAYYGDSEIIVFDDAVAAGEALRLGTIDTLFGDNLGLIYWVSGATARGCCRLLDGTFSDFDYFSRNLAFLVRRDRGELRQAFDHGLDMAQKRGVTARIIKAYVPLNPW